MKIKICGITRPEDAQAVVDAGADYLGFIFYEGSPRYVTPEKAAAILAGLKGEIKTVGVFVNAPAGQIFDIIAQCRLDVVQLHGDEPEAFAAQFPRRQVWKAVHLREASDIERWRGYPASALVLDARCGDRRGGTGRRCDWNLAALAAERFPVVLAGGITPDNAVAAALAVRPVGLDVNSGVETAPGVKDPDKIKTLINHLKNTGIC